MTDRKRPGRDAERLELLVVDDDAEIAGDLARLLERVGHSVEHAGTSAEALGRLRAHAFDVALVDLQMPGMSGLQLLDELGADDLDCEFVMLTGHGSIESAVTAMKLGAADFLTKPVGLQELDVVVRRAAERRRMRVDNRRLKLLLDRARPEGELIGSSPPMTALRTLIERIAASDRPALVVGESGTGKELVARALHAGSGRADKPLVSFNGAALAETLAESELFGHERGAFTGADESRPGLFEAADGGTLFIDEVGELPQSIQAKLLRALEDGAVRRVGSVRERRVDVRVIAATNRDLAAEAVAGRFREDLLYRLNVLTLEVPPLRDREGDIALLATHFAGDEWAFEEGLTDKLAAYGWPGNVRQLANAIERAKVLATDQTIRQNGLPPEIVERLTAVPVSATDAGRGRAGSLDDLNRQHVAETYERHERNKSQTARALGVSRRALYRLLERYGIE
ncbi:MAG: sigma-54 dependent transcriptional regulator [Planctomycetota bacterium]